MVFSIHNRILASVKRIKRRRGENKTLAIDGRANDFYIVEFPKSGVTWLSTILGSMALKASGRAESVTFPSSNLYVPDIHLTRSVGPVAYHVPPVRFIKSHAGFNSRYVFVIYLVRHPLSVMKSYYRFLKDLNANPHESFDSFCRSRKYGIRAWNAHVESWLGGRNVGQRLHLCRYEDLINDAHSEIMEINANFGWNISAAIIDQAVRDSSMQNMKKSEERYRSHNPRHSMHFVGGGGQFEVAESTVDYIQDEARVSLKLLGYDR